MAKYIDPKCRLCRREGVKLYLKGARCLSPKCPIGKRVDVPSFQTKPGMIISLPEHAAKFDFVAPNLIEKNAPAKWLSRVGTQGKVDRMPTADEIGSDIKTNLIIEFYSR